MTKARTLADNYAADISGITAGTGITGGGTSGTVTITNEMATTIDAKGDLVVGTGADTFGRLAVASTAGYLLTVDSAEATGLKWAAASSGGMTLLASGSLSGATVTISSISGAYEHLQVIGRDSNVYIVYDDNNGGNFDVLNIESQGNNVAAYTNTNLNIASMGIGYNDPGTTDLIWIMNVFNYSRSGTKKIYQGLASGGNNIFQLNASCRGTSAITEVTLLANTGTFSAGTYEIWGIK